MGTNHGLGGPGKTEAADVGVYHGWSTGPLVSMGFSSSYEPQFVRASAPREQTDWRNLPRCDYCRQLAVRFLASQYVLICDDYGGCLACGAPLEFEHLSDHEHVKAVGVPRTVRTEGIGTDGSDSSSDVHIELMAIDDASEAFAFQRIAQDANELSLAVGNAFLPIFKRTAEGLSKLGELLDD